ncbi:MAG: hypothetical protein GF370_02865 [Candidatus Nealsonbacteria bacterium]|nr:hypothetical protein [Candidatus Nealsonbacteria bacterium]
MPNRLAEEVRKLNELKGEARGAGLKNNIEFVIQKEGGGAVRKIEDEMEKVGYPIKYKRIKTLAFYPLSLEAALLLVINKLFDYNSDDFQEMGRFGAKSSLIIKLFTRYFVSFERFKSKPPEMWKKYFSVGEVELQEFNEEEKYAVVELKDFKINKFHCSLLSGFFSSLLEMMIGEKVIGEEAKCPFDGDDHHEFLLKW